MKLYSMIMYSHKDTNFEYETTAFAVAAENFGKACHIALDMAKDFPGFDNPCIDMELSYEIETVGNYNVVLERKQN